MNEKRERHLLPKILGAAGAALLIAGTVAAFTVAGPRGLTTALSPVQGLLPPAQPPPHKPYIPAIPVAASPAKFTHPVSVPVPPPVLVVITKPHLPHKSKPHPVTIGPSPVTTTTAPKPSSSPSPAPSVTPSPSPSPTPSPSPSPAPSPASPSP